MLIRSLGEWCEERQGEVDGPREGKDRGVSEMMLIEVDLLGSLVKLEKLDVSMYGK